jgi:hypothetical protein
VVYSPKTGGGRRGVIGSQSATKVVTNFTGFFTVKYTVILNGADYDPGTYQVGLFAINAEGTGLQTQTVTLNVTQ